MGCSKKSADTADSVSKFLWKTQSGIICQCGTYGNGPDKVKSRREILQNYRIIDIRLSEEPGGKDPDLTRSIILGRLLITQETAQRYAHTAAFEGL